MLWQGCNSLQNHRLFQSLKWLKSHILAGGLAAKSLIQHRLLKDSLLFQNIPAPFGIHSVDSLPAGQLRLPTQGGPRNSHQGLGFISVLQEVWAHCPGHTWLKWAGCGKRLEMTTAHMMLNSRNHLLANIRTFERATPLLWPVS